MHRSYEDEEERSARERRRGQRVLDAGSDRNDFSMGVFVSRPFEKYLLVSQNWQKLQSFYVALVEFLIVTITMILLQTPFKLARIKTHI